LLGLSLVLRDQSARMRKGPRVRPKRVSDIEKHLGKIQLEQHGNYDERIEVHSKKPCNMTRIARLAQPRRLRSRKKTVLIDLIQVVLVHICQFLDISSLLKFSCTCKSLDEIVKLDQVWETQGASAGIHTREAILAARRQKVILQRETISKMVKRIRESVGVNNSLAVLVDKLKVTGFSALLNGTSLELLGFRRKTQQGFKQEFRVHSAVSAPNLAEGVLIFDQACVLKFAIPPGFTVNSLKTLQVRSQSKVKKTPRICFEANFERSKLYGYRHEKLCQYHAGRASSVDFIREKEEVSLAIVSLHHVDLLASYRIQTEQSLPIRDDLPHCLHGFSCSVTLRSFGTSYWSDSFRNLSGKKMGQVLHIPILNGNGFFADVSRLLQEDSKTSSDSLDLYFRSEIFSGNVKAHTIIDFSLWDENDEIFWSFSRTLPVKERAEVSFDFQGKIFQVSYKQPSFGKFALEFGKMHDISGTFVKTLDVGIEWSRIENWFAS